MTTQVKASVQRLPKTGGTPLGEQWLTIVYTLNENPTPDHLDIYETAWSGSVHEALQAAEFMRQRVEQQLMDEVHESRASRRAGKQ